MNRFAVCSDCKGGGSVNGTYGWGTCSDCAGFGNVEVRLCDICVRADATSCSDEDVALCDRCAGEFAPAPRGTHWECACGNTHFSEDAGPGISTTYVECGCSRRMRQVAASVPPARDTEPCLVAPEVVDDEADARIAALMQSALLVEDARAIGWEPHEVFRAMRRANIAKGG